MEKKTVRFLINENGFKISSVTLSNRDEMTKKSETHGTQISVTRYEGREATPVQIADDIFFTECNTRYSLFWFVMPARKKPREKSLEAAIDPGISSEQLHF
jgi:hypothetical protein